MLTVFLVAFFVSFVLCLILTPISLFISERFKIYDYPSRRKVHTHPIPRLGGLAIFLSIVLTIIVLLNLSQPFRDFISYSWQYKYKDEMIKLSLSRQLTGMFISSTIIFILGLADDIRRKRAMTKLLVQIIAAYCAMDFGIKIFGLQPPFIKKYLHFPLILIQVITILWLLMLMNSINLIDGLDGLAAGITFIIMFSFFIISFIQSQTGKIFFQKQLTLSAVISLIVAGACLGFLPYNFHPAKIFLGDSGALTLGFFIGTTSIIGLLKITTVISLFIPILVMAIPISEISISIIRRLIKKEHIMRPDKEHIHHRLLKSGWTHREIVLAMYCVTLLLALISVGLASIR